MLTMAMTPGFNRDIIWIIRVDMDGSYFYFSTEIDKITLSGVDFDGKVMFKDSLSNMEEGIMGNAIDGGNIGIVSNFSFSLCRYTDHSGSSNFFNDFYPATSKPLLTSKTVDVGIGWRYSGDAIPVAFTSMSQITWGKQYYIQAPKVYYNKIDLFCVEYDELASKQLPYHIVQKDVDNGISYFANAPDDAYGQAIPILYGWFATIGFLIYRQYRLCPTIRTDKNNSQYIIASHICKTVSTTNLYKYIDSGDTVMILSGASVSHVNSRRGYLFNLNSNSTTILGEIYIQPKINAGGIFADIGTEAFDDSETSFDSVAVNDTIAFQLGSKITNSDLGALTGTAANVTFNILWSSSDVYNQTIRMQLYNPNSIQGNGAGYRTGNKEETTNAFSITSSYEIGDANYDYGNNPRCFTDTSQWNLEELGQQCFTVWNKNTNSAPIKIFNSYLHLQNIRVFVEATSRFGINTPQPRIIHIGGVHL
jgi:hypothetical protein